VLTPGLTPPFSPSRQGKDKVVGIGTYFRRDQEEEDLALVLVLVVRRSLGVGNHFNSTKLTRLPHLGYMYPGTRAYSIGPPSQNILVKHENESRGIFVRCTCVDAAGGGEPARPLARSLGR